MRNDYTFFNEHEKYQNYNRCHKVNYHVSARDLEAILDEVSRNDLSEKRGTKSFGTKAES